VPMSSTRRSYILRLDPELVAQVEDDVLRPGVGNYIDLSDFVATALKNQLTLETSGDPVSRLPQAHLASAVLALERRQEDAPLLQRPTALLEQLAEPVRVGTPFFVLTNRLAPMAFAARVLANLATDGWPSLDRFLDSTAVMARTLGLRLREQDVRDGRRGLLRRYVGWPVGDEVGKTLERFKWSFLLWPESADGQGPLAECGIASVLNGKAALTELGRRLADSPSALLGEAHGWTLSVDQQEVLRAGLAAMPGERPEIAFFLGAVKEARGEQPRLDALIRTRHPEWTSNRATAHRAAMLGRLRDIGVLDVRGWGPKAKITTAPEADDFLNTITSTNPGGERT
jgi:hypothetical protein